MIDELKRFNHLTGEIEALYHEAALKLGMSDSAMNILYTICNVGDNCLLSDICRLSGTSKQTIHSAVRILENDGIVYLEAKSGRKKAVCLTEKGKAKVKATVARVIEIENQIFSSWTKLEREEYLRLTKDYMLAFKEKIDSL